MDPRRLLVLWGKVGSGGDATSFHPLLCHLIDVALVARAMWQTVLPPAARSRLAESLGVEQETAEGWLAFWAGLHDLGKASPTFQGQHRAAWARVRAAGFSGHDGILRTPHGTVTACTLPEALRDGGFNLPGPVAAQIATVLGGHHGVFPSSREIQNSPAAHRGRGSWEQARLALVNTLADLLDLPRHQCPRQIDNATAMVLAGFVSVADWIGSNTEFFPYAVRDEGDLSRLEAGDYARGVRDQARRALERLGWSGWSPPEGAVPFETLFPRLEAPNPLQQWVVALAARLREPGLVIVEAPMGEGKTEAAMYLADAWAATFGQRGCYFALPTQATSNQMFSRVREFLAERYDEGLVNLQLLHGQAALSAELKLLRDRFDRLFEPEGIHGEAGYDGAPANVVAAEWFTYRKRGLLAPFGVGTVDQALLAVLQTRHVFVRLFGLAHKTVIVDEVHAYDTYMTALLERLLEWLGALGAAVVLLSATLPCGRRDALARAYAKGLGRADAAALPLPAEPYPRVTWVTPSAAGARHVATSGRSTKTVTMTWVDGRLPLTAADPFELGERLRDALQGGGCAVVICNTVGRAQQVYCALKLYFPDQADDGWPELDLLHARYLFEDRDAREKRALLRFGKPGGKVQLTEGDEREVGRPWRAVLVATQIVEQSLDLDFDLMVTDLAPADLVLQRMGRLHRHDRDRPAGLSKPVLWLSRPEKRSDGLPGFSRGDEAVYDPHVLLRSWLALEDRAAVVVPDDVEELVEAVYGERACPAELGEVLRQRWDETLQSLRANADADQHEARTRWLKSVDYDGALWRLMGDPREEDAPDFHRAHQALTRLAELTVAVVCLYGSPDRPTFDPGGREDVSLGPPHVGLARRLLRRSVSLGDRRVVWKLFETPPPATWTRSPLLRNHRLLTFDATSAKRVGDIRVGLDVELGLVVGE